MKIKTLLIQAIAILTIALAACDDDLNQIGNSIQPDGDKIFIGTDTVYVTAKTVSFKDSIYSRTVFGLLGEYIDPVFGKVKSDYMSEFYCPENIKFEDGTFSIDSIFLKTYFKSFIGDSVAPIGLSVYGIKNPLKAFFFTSVDPEKYIGKDPILYGQKIFSIQDLPDTIRNSDRYKYINTKLDMELAYNFYNEWKTNPSTFKNQEDFNQFFKGLYVTTNFGSGSLIGTHSTEMVIHYRNFVKNAANTADSVVFSTFKLPITNEVIQMNQIKNDIPEELYDHNETKTYLKTPAGVYTEITIPLKSIVEKGDKEYGKDHTINAANFKMIGFTEEEEKSGLGRATSLLLINKDSLTNFFYNKKKPDNKTSFVITRSSTNSYDFGNISTIINHYADHYRDKGEIPDLNYLIIPVSTSYTTVSNQNVLTGVYNQMYPTSTIFRTDPENMKMAVIYSKYNNKNKTE